MTFNFKPADDLITDMLEHLAVLEPIQFDPRHEAQQATAILSKKALSFYYDEGEALLDQSSKAMENGDIDDVTFAMINGLRTRIYDAGVQMSKPDGQRDLQHVRTVLEEARGNLDELMGEFRPAAASTVSQIS